MTDSGFSTLTADAMDFMGRLGANNNRDWFNAHKKEYEARVKRPAELMLDEMAQWIGREMGEMVKPKLYRIHRDLRFSKDKTPYNTHLHLQWSATEGPPICRLLGLSQGYFCAGVGSMTFPPAELARWRESIAGQDGAVLAEGLEALLAAGHRIDPPALKRVPAPYGQDHPKGDLLRRKSLIVWRDLDDAAARDPLAALKQAFRDLQPLQQQLHAMLSKE